LLGVLYKIFFVSAFVLVEFIIEEEDDDDGNIDFFVFDLFDKFDNRVQLELIAILCSDLVYFLLGFSILDFD